jgi:sigma-B regulation protein RsbU (phosphoserine phosphatase)
MITKPIVYHEFKRMQGFSLCSIIKSVNERVASEFEKMENFITGIILRFDDNSVEYVNAGHTDLLLKKAAKQTVRAVEAEGMRFRGEPIGLNNFNIMCKVLRFNVAKGDYLVLYTDCVVESTDADGFMYGRQRLVDSLRAAPDGTAQEVLDHLMGGFRDFVKDGQINDDLTVIVARRTR